MKQITILSGKGGTGKTTIAASFAALAEKLVVADCDVDAPDLHMLLNPKIIQKEEFEGSKLATIDESKCTRCGICQEKCRFNAIMELPRIDPFTCEGCGVCVIACPMNAITLVARTSGQVYVSETKYGFMVHALLNPGEANSGKLVTLVRQKARMIAEREGSSFIIVDGSPGIGCPVIASIATVDAGLVITEPSISGIHDLKRALKLLAHFNILPLVCINMCDINQCNTEKIVKFCKEVNIELVGKVPFNPLVTKAMLNGKPIVEYAPESDVTRELRETWTKICLTLEANC